MIVEPEPGSIDVVVLVFPAQEPSSLLLKVWLQAN